MKIEFTKKEYIALLDILQISDWVLHALRTKEPPGTLKYRKLTQKIYALAAEFDCGDLVGYEKELKEYFPTAEDDLDSPVMQLVSEFENDSFWDELVDRFTQRDVQRTIGAEALRKLSVEERIEKICPIEERWGNELADHGINRLEVRE